MSLARSHTVLPPSPVTDRDRFQLTATEMEPEESVAALRVSEVNIAIAYEMFPLELPARFEGRELLLEPLALAVPAVDPTLTGSTSTEPIDLASLSGRQCVSSQQGTSCHQMVQQTCGSAYLAPNTIAYCSDLATQLTMAANHIGIRGRSPIDREGGSGRTGCLVG
ncbi:LysR substrate-binding domain-containing protein [Streptomyces mirabilis]|uniref:LysR substrate-binding domain-containing protein n=1 Tax=Streptomyces mirabilis TaxID=68239 RepID=UPI0036A12CA5